MNQAVEAEKLMAGLSRAEKARLLQRLTRSTGDAFQGIASREWVLDGEACVARKRIPV